MVVRYNGKNKFKIKAGLLNVGHESRSDFFFL